MPYQVGSFPRLDGTSLQATPSSVGSRGLLIELPRLRGTGGVQAESLPMTHFNWVVTDSTLPTTVLANIE